MSFLTSGWPNTVAYASSDMNTIETNEISTNVHSCSRLAKRHHPRQRSRFSSEGTNT